LRFSEWSKASTILVYDADSSSISESSNINGLLRKFRNEGFPAENELAWLKGGFVAVWRERSDLVVSGPDNSDEDEEDDTLPQMSAFSNTLNPSFLLRTKNLPMSAFTQTSTTSQRPSGSHIAPAPVAATPNIPAPSHPIKQSTPSLAVTELVGSNKPTVNTPQPPTMAFNPFYDTVRQNLELSQGISERIPLTLPSNVRERIDDLPFQWLRHIARRAAPAETEYSPPGSSHEDAMLSPFSSEDLSTSDTDPSVTGTPPRTTQLVEEGTEALAMQFYRIELGEQRRLMGIMQHHSQESGHVMKGSSSEESLSGLPLGEKPKAPRTARGAREVQFPYSITAGVEKGAKNRYRNIWPFEHARVRLHQHSPSTDDYINASFVQPLGTHRRYIATQGPLEATLRDFWTLVWEQNVHVIVMLTKEFEGMQAKSANYWGSAQHGPLTLTLIDSTETKEEEVKRNGAEGWSWGGSKPVSLPAPTIRRSLELRHSGYPQAGTRSITQFQYLDWPDLNVPEDPRGILNLVKEVDKEVDRSLTSPFVDLQFETDSSSETMFDDGSGVMKHAIANPPVLLHCSAGVGRTGGFIAVDAVLDGIRRNIRKRRDQRIQRRQSQQQGDKDVVMSEEQPDSDQPMQVDEGTSSHWIQSPTPDSGLVMPIHGGDDGEMVLHVPVVGWGLESGGDSSSEDVSERDSADQDQPTQMDVDAAASHNKKRQGLTQTSPWMSTRGELKEWLGNTANSKSEPNEPPTRPSPPTRASSSEDSPRDGELASGSGSSAYGSGNSSSDPNILAKNMSHPQAQRGSLPSSSSPSTRSSSAGLQGRGSNTDGDVSDMKSSRHSASIAPSPPRSTTVDSSSSSGKRDGSNKKTVSSTRVSSPFGSSVRDSTSSIFDIQRRDTTTPATSSRTGTDPSLKRGVGLSGGSSTNLVEVEEANSPPKRSPLHSSAIVADEAPSGPDPDNHTQAFDYTDPRPLYDDESPSLLTTYDEPVRRIVEDMREQRMSLCQSLRQYVFVHRAIIEGSLMIVDEEKATVRRQRKAQVVIDGDEQALAPEEIVGPSIAIASTAPVSNRGKRNASPTELIREDKSGDLALSKRPSIKRKQRSDENLTESSDAAAIASFPLNLWPPTTAPSK